MLKRTMLGNLEGAVRRERGGKEKEWTDYVQSDIRGVRHSGELGSNGVEGRNVR